ncbi:PaaX family transcriptional regulator C-terminal domain-containing protein [Brachybacterium endophyticum]|nr:PaaX family transcriptional regulator C-terminal domain-containing protein [Brachybacterium endophyticum]
MTDLERYRRTDRAQDVGFVFAAVGATHLPGPALVRMLTHLHMTESAARNTLAKMVRLQRLDVEACGRISVYSLGEVLARRFRQVEGAAPPTPWDGGFDTLVHQVPEGARWFRDRLVYYARFHGYGTLRPGVLIGVHPDVDLALGQVGEPPTGAVLHRARMIPASLEEARDMASRAWELGTIARTYETLGAQVDRQFSGGPPPADAAGLWSTFEAWARLYQQVTSAVIRDPHLPHELLPASWPARRFFTRLDRLNRDWGPPLQSFLRAQVEESAGGLARYEPLPWERG